MKYLAFILLLSLCQIDLYSQKAIKYGSELENDLYSVSFPSDSTGYAVGKDGYMVKTTDSGNSWIDIGQANITMMLYSVQFINDTLGFICGNGLFAATIDGGGSWLEYGNFSTILTSVFFISDNLGFLTDIEGYVYKTIDAGVNWSSEQIDYPLEIKDITFTSPDTGYCVGSFQVGLDEYEGKIYKTVNNGESWNSVYTYNTDSDWFNEIDFFDKHHGIAISNYGNIIYTNNEGQTWNNKKIFYDGWLSSIMFAKLDLILISTTVHLK